MNEIEIRQMTREDIPAICQADNDETESFVDYLNRQLDFQDNGECAALLALCDGKAAGYVFLFYECRWGALKNQGLPGICDLVVFEPYRRKRIATGLMDSAEALARRVNTKIYLDVCLNATGMRSLCNYPKWTAISVQLIWARSWIFPNLKPPCLRFHKSLWQSPHSI